MIRTSSNRYKVWEDEIYEGTYSSRFMKKREQFEPPVHRPPATDGWPKTVMTRLGELPLNRPDTIVVTSSTSASPPEQPEENSENYLEPPHPQIFSFQTVPDIDQSKLEPEVIVREGIDMTTEEMKNQLAFIPEITPGPTSIHVNDLDFGEPDQPEEERAKMKDVLAKYMPFFIQTGNGLPPAARGAVCDIDVGNARPIAQRARRVRPEHLKQLFELLKGLLGYGLITFSKSPWASPIVIVLKKGGKDIRLCIDYRAINDLQSLLLSPMPTLDTSSLYEISREEIEAGVISETAKMAFEKLKLDFAHLPTLKHAALDKEVHILIYTTGWAISATVCQEDDGVLFPIRFCGRVLKGGETRYEGWAKEILALLRVLKTCFFEVRNRVIVVYTRFGLMKWLLKDKQAKAENLHWAAMLAPWTIKVIPVDELDGRWNLSIMLTETLHPPDESTHEKLALFEPNRSKVGLQPRQVQMPTFTGQDEGYVAAFDGAIKVKERFGSWGAIIWKLPEWSQSGLASGHPKGYQVHPRFWGLQTGNPPSFGVDAVQAGTPASPIERPSSSRATAFERRVHHILRQWNGSADHLASMGLALRREVTELSTADLDDIQGKNLLAEIIQPPPDATDPLNNEQPAKSILAYTHPMPTSRVVGLNSQIRLRRVSDAQDQERKWSIIKQFLRGEVENLTQEECSKASKEAGMYEIGEEGALFRLNWSTKRCNLPIFIWTLVIPTELNQMILHHCHDSVEGGHFKNYVTACETCASGGPPPTTQARSPGNLIPQGPLELVNFDIATDFPRSFGGNTQLVVFVDNFTGFVMCKPTPDRSAHTLAKAFEETVFVRFGACREVRHDREPSFMGEGFTHFMKMIGQSPMPTFAYRPQENGTAKRAIQTLVRSVKLYVTDPRQRDGDEYAVRLTFAINTTPSATRGDTPFYLMHGWDPFTTITASLPATKSGDHEANRCRSQLHQQHVFCKAMAHDLLCQAEKRRAEAHNAQLPPAVDERIKFGDLVWVYIDQVKAGVKKKLAHLWHGPFRVLDKKHDYASVFEIQGRLALRNNRFHAEVHDSRLKPQRVFQLRPTERMDGQPPVDFDEGLYLPPDSFELDPDEPHVFGIRAVRYTDHIKEYEVQLETDGAWTGLLRFPYLPQP
ncbi:hypothetical protein Ae201684P_015885 [Aphanomyces euteiches]|nr:hypothetical protein Ae201684P_015885 [Aphanomyces euteiches]